jgi:hypothetical protein
MEKNEHNEFSEEKLLKILKDLIIPKDINKEFVVQSGCKTHGIVELGLNCCSDPECTNCALFWEAVKKYKNEKE